LSSTLFERKITMSYCNPLAISERENIFLLFNLGKSIYSIASVIRRHRSTISRELKRNIGDENYSPNHAQMLYASRKKKCGRKLILSTPKTWKIVRRLFVEE
jgi:IS30 family transposase